MTAMLSSLESWATLLAGIGIYFFSTNYVSRHFFEFSSGALRKILDSGRGLTKPFAFSAGVILYLIMHSSQMMASVLGTMGRAGLIGLERTFFVLIGGGVGASLLVLIYLATNGTVLGAIAMVLLSLSGIFYRFGSRHSRPAAQLFFTFGLMLFSISLIREGGTEIQASMWAQVFFANVASKPWLCLAAGIVLALIVQSSFVVVIIGALAFSDIQDSLAASVMLAYGANLGATAMQGIQLYGTQGAVRQSTFLNITIEALVGAILISLFVLERQANLPLILAAIDGSEANPIVKAAFAHMVFKMAPLALLPLSPLLTAQVRRIMPISESEKISTPRYLTRPIPEEAGLALKLVELEQVRLLGALHDVLGSARGTYRLTDPEGIVAAYDALEEHISNALADIAQSSSVTGERLEHFDALATLQGDLRALRTAIMSLTESLVTLRGKDNKIAFPDALIEGLDFILMLLIDAAKDGQKSDFAAVEELTADDGNGVNSVRKAYLSNQSALDQAGQTALLAAANQGERVIWLFGAVARHLGRVPS